MGDSRCGLFVVFEASMDAADAGLSREGEK